MAPYCYLSYPTSISLPNSVVRAYCIREAFIITHNWPVLYLRSHLTEQIHFKQLSSHAYIYIYIYIYIYTTHATNAKKKKYAPPGMHVELL